MAPLGSSTETVKIESASELVALSEGFGTQAYPIDGKYELSTNIDMDNVGFSAIGGGTKPTPFLGTFDGNGYTISNLKIESVNGSTGFFAYIGTGGNVENLKPMQRLLVKVAQVQLLELLQGQLKILMWMEK